MVTPHEPKPLIDPGQVVATPGAVELPEGADVTAESLLDRHVYGDWVLFIALAGIVGGFLWSSRGLGFGAGFVGGAILLRLLRKWLSRRWHAPPEEDT